MNVSKQSIVGQNYMHTKPTVSTIMPFYNTPGTFIQEAIKSVFAQRYDSWELLLVDDGSIGESTDIARDFAKRYPEHVRYLEHPAHENRGLSASRTLGITEAKGQFIAFLDSDDVWLPHKLEQQLAIIDAHPEVMMIYGNTQYWYSWTGSREDQRRDFIPKLGVRAGTVVHPPALLPLFLRGEAAVPCTCSIVVRREVFEQIGGFEASFPNMYEDQVFYSKVCLEAPVLVADTCWDRYRQHPGSTCSTAERTGQERAARRTFLNWLEQYVAARQIKDPEVWKALREELRRHETSQGSDVSDLAQYFRRRMRKLVRRMRPF
jgi:glycosyltransferase involved in cell wall biosynthesis